MKRSKKKNINNRKLTIVKVLPKNGTISQKDLDTWHEIFRNNHVSGLDKSVVEAAAQATGEVEIQHIPTESNGKHFLTLVRVGGDKYTPTHEELEEWRQVFEEASKDPDFTIFTHKDVEIEVIEIGKVVAVE